MKKEERNLVWKLGDLPNAGQLADLVNSEVITKEEAREIMFGSPGSDKDRIKALEDQVELLLGLVKSLSNRTPQAISIPYTYTPNQPRWGTYWAYTSKTLGDSGITLTSTSSSGPSGQVMMSVNTANLLS